MDWHPIDTAPKERVLSKLQTVLLVGRYPNNGNRTDIIESWWNPTDERWERWKHDFSPSFWMLPPNLPNDI